MKKTKLLLLVFILGLSFNSCSDDLDSIEGEENTILDSNTLNSKLTTHYLYDYWNKTKAPLNSLDFCDYVQITSVSNGHQMRSRINLNWTVDVNFPPPPPPPGILRYDVEFQPGISIGGVLSYGTPYFFEEEFISTQTNISVSYDALSQLDGSVQGRWRVRVEDCDWTDWEDYYFDL